MAERDSCACEWTRRSVGAVTRPGGDDIGGPVQQSSPQPAAVGTPPYRPMLGLRLDRTRVLEVIPNTPPDGQVGVILSTVGVAGDMP